VDWSLFHALNGALRGQDGAQDVVQQFGSISVPVFAIATCLLWFFARPGRSVRLKLAALSALASASLGLLVNQAIGHLWFRDRPFAANPRNTLLLTHPSHDPSFPSDHATAAFAIAFAVFFFNRRVGGLFIVGAIAIGLSRIFLGLHYPGDVAAGAGVGFGSALLVTTAGRPYVEWSARQASRLSDPLVGAPLRAVRRGL
jgi:undecaprenyl-diphosphatase